MEFDIEIGNRGVDPHVEIIVAEPGSITVVTQPPNNVNGTLLGGSADQVLTKRSSQDYDWSWQDIPAGSGGGSSSIEEVDTLPLLAGYSGSANQVYVIQENAIYTRSNLLNADVTNDGLIVVHSNHNSNPWVRDSTSHILNLRDVVDSSGNALDTGSRRNHTEFFQRALDACNDKEIFARGYLNTEDSPLYNTLYIPAGDYGIDRTLTVRCNVISSSAAAIYFWQPPKEDTSIDWRDHRALFAIGSDGSEYSYDTTKYSTQADPFVDATDLHTWQNVDSILRLGSLTDGAVTSCVKIAGTSSTYLQALETVLKTADGQVLFTSFDLNVSNRTATARTVSLPNIPAFEQNKRLRLLQIEYDINRNPTDAKFYQNVYIDGTPTLVSNGVYDIDLKFISTDFTDDNPSGGELISESVQIVLYYDFPTYKYYFETDCTIEDSNHTIPRLVHVDLQSRCIFFDQSGKYMVDEDSSKSPYMRGKVRTSSAPLIKEARNYNIHLPTIYHSNLSDNYPIFNPYTRVNPPSNVFATGTIEPDYSIGIHVKAVKNSTIRCNQSRNFSTYQLLTGGNEAEFIKGVIGCTFYGGNSVGSKRMIDIKPRYANGLKNGGYVNSNRFFEYLTNNINANLLVGGSGSNKTRPAQIRVDGIVNLVDFYSSIPSSGLSCLEDAGYDSTSRLLCFLFSGATPDLKNPDSVTTTFDISRVKPRYYVHVMNSENYFNMLTHYSIQCIFQLEGANAGKYLIVTNYGEGNEIYGDNYGQPQTGWFDEDGTNAGNSNLYVFIKYGMLGSHPTHTDPNTTHDFVRDGYSLVSQKANPAVGYGGAGHNVFIGNVFEEHSGLGYKQYDLVGVGDTRFLSTRAEVSLRKVPPEEFKNHILIDGCDNIMFDHGFELYHSDLVIDSRSSTIPFSRSSSGIVFKDRHREDLNFKNTQKNLYKTTIFETVFDESKGTQVIDFADTTYTKDSKFTYFPEVAKLNERQPVLLSSHNNQIVDLEYAVNFKLPSADKGYHVEVLNTNLIPLKITTIDSSVSYSSIDDYILPSGSARIINRGNDKYIVTGDLGVDGTLSTTYSNILSSTYVLPADQPASGQQKLQDMVVRHLEDFGIWDKIKKMGVFGRTTEEMSLIDWKNPGDVNDSFETLGTTTNPFNSAIGYTANGTGYINTNSSSTDLADDNVTIYAFLTETSDRNASVVVDSTGRSLRLTIEIDESAEVITGALIDDVTGEPIDDEGLEDNEFFVSTIENNQIIFDGVISNAGFTNDSRIYVRDSEQNTLLGIVDSYSIVNKYTTSGGNIINRSVTVIQLKDIPNLPQTRVIYQNPIYQVISPQSEQILFGVNSGADPRAFLLPSTNKVSLHGLPYTNTVNVETIFGKSLAFTRRNSNEFEVSQDGLVQTVPQAFDTNNTTTQSIQIFKSGANNIANDFSVGAFIIAEALSAEELNKLKELFEAYYS